MVEKLIIKRVPRHIIVNSIYMSSEYLDQPRFEPKTKFKVVKFVRPHPTYLRASLFEGPQFLRRMISVGNF